MLQWYHMYTTTVLLHYYTITLYKYQHIVIAWQHNSHDTSCFSGTTYTLDYYALILRMYLCSTTYHYITV
jgi:hypothetical protein